MDAATLIYLAPCSLLLGAVLQLLVARFLSPRAKGILAFLTCLPAIFGVAGIAPLVRNGQAIDLKPLPWDGPLAFVLHVDALSVLFAFMGSVIGGLVLLYSIGYMAEEKAATRFYATMLIFIGGFIGLVYSANLFIFYIFWEMVGLCSFSLVGFWYTNPESVRGARKVLLMTHIAGYALLAAILVLYYRSGSALWTDPAVQQSLSTGLFILMLIALVAKSVQVPLHTWIPEAMAAPTPVSALLHAACYVKAGVYLAARLHSFGAWPAPWGESLMWVGTVTMAVGVMYAMVQTDLKRMLAFSTVSQIGYMMMGLGIGTPLAITAGLLHCLNHGFFKGGLFLTAGSVQHAAGTRDMNQLGGLAQKMPKTTLSWLIGVGSMMGIPLMSGFASKWLLYAAALQAGWAVPAMVAWAASLGTVFLGAKATSAVFLGATTEKTEHAHESAPTMVWGMGLLAVGSIVLGIAPQLAVNYLLNPILLAMGMSSGVNVTWFGLSADAGSFSSMGGLVLAVISIVLGGAIYLIAYAARPSQSAAVVGAGGGVFTGGEPLSAEGRLTAGDFSEIFEQHWSGFFRWSNVDAVYLGVWSGLQAVSRVLGAIFGWLEKQAALLVVVFAAALLVGVKFLLPAAAIAEGATPVAVPNLLIAACAVAAVALLIAALTQAAWRKLLPLMFVSSAAAIAGLAMPNAWLRLGLLELGALATIPLVWQCAKTTAAKCTYATVVLISALTLVSSDLLFEHGQAGWAQALLITSVCVKLAALPLFFWLLKLADEVPALVLGAIIAVVDMAAFGEFYVTAQASPLAIGSQSFWIVLAACTSFTAALLMITQRSLKRMLVLSTVEDVGFLFLGVASASALGAEGALAAAATHALAKALLFICLSGPEAAGLLETEPAGLAAKYPVSAFGFLFGMLAMLGVPPTLGFIGRWRLYTTALHVCPWAMAIFIVSSILALVAYVMALARNWWGPPKDPDSPPGVEPFAQKIVIVVLVILLVAAGSVPGMLEFLKGVQP
jgi:multicomponent Na+:H+ antiporter subunit A